MKTKKIRVNSTERADWEEHRTKMSLADAINEIIRQRGMTQTEAAVLVGVNQPKVSALARRKVDGFSVERLMNFLTALDRDIEIVIRTKPRSRASAQISVVAN